MYLYFSIQLHVHSVTCIIRFMFHVYILTGVGFISYYCIIITYNIISCVYLHEVQVYNCYYDIYHNLELIHKKSKKFNS